MNNIIILDESDIRDDIKKFDPDLDISDPNLYDFKFINREDTHRANLIIYLYREDNKTNYSLLKHRYPKEHYNTLIHEIIKQYNTEATWDKNLPFSE